MNMGRVATGLNLYVRAAAQSILESPVLFRVEGARDPSPDLEEKIDQNHSHLAWLQLPPKPDLTVPVIEPSYMAETYESSLSLA